MPCATTGSVWPAPASETSAMSKARWSAAESWRLLVGYSTSSTAPVLTMSLRAALGLGPRASTTAGRRSSPAAGQAGHAGVAVEDGAGDQDVKGALLADLLDHVDHIGAGDHLVARAERGLDGPAERRGAADDENPAGDHGAVVVWSVPMHCPDRRWVRVLLGLDDRDGLVLREELDVPRASTG